MTEREIRIGAAGVRIRVGEEIIVIKPSRPPVAGGGTSPIRIQIVDPAESDSETEVAHDLTADRSLLLIADADGDK